MPRDAAGNYTLPPGINPVVPGTDIEADWANPTLEDVANALSDSLSRTGSGGMLVPFKFADGAIGAPSITWTNQPQSGWYRAATDDFRYVINGVDILQLQMTAVTIKKPLTVNGSVTTPTGTLISDVDATAVAITYAVALG